MTSCSRADLPGLRSVSTTRVHGPSTRPVNSGSGNRPLGALETPWLRYINRRLRLRLRNDAGNKLSIQVYLSPVNCVVPLYSAGSKGGGHCTPHPLLLLTLLGHVHTSVLRKTNFLYIPFLYIPDYLKDSELVTNTRAVQVFTENNVIHVIAIIVIIACDRLLLFVCDFLFTSKW